MSRVTILGTPNLNDVQTELDAGRRVYIDEREVVYAWLGTDEKPGERIVVFKDDRTRPLWEQR